MALSLNLQYPMVYDENNQCVPGIFQHLAPEDAAKFRQVIQSKTRAWQQSAITAGFMCGTFVEAERGQGSGKGALFLSPFELDPSLASE